MTPHDDLATLRDALLEAGREIHAHSDHPERIDFAAVLAEIDKAIAAARRVEAEIARLEELNESLKRVGSRAAREAEAAEAEIARLRTGIARQLTPLDVAVTHIDILRRKMDGYTAFERDNVLAIVESHANETRAALFALLADQDGAAFDPKGEFGKFYKHRGGAA